MNIKKLLGRACYWLGDKISYTINWLPYGYPVYNWLMRTSDKLDQSLWLPLTFDYPVIIKELCLLDVRYENYTFDVRVNGEVIHNVVEFYSGIDGYVIEELKGAVIKKRIIHDGLVSVFAIHKHDL